MPDLWKHGFKQTKKQPQRREKRKKPVKILTVPATDLDEMWDEIKAAFRSADADFDQLMYDVDAGGEVNPGKRKALKAALSVLEHKINVFRLETDV